MARKSRIWLWLAWAGCLSALAAERTLDLTTVKPNELPKGWRSALAGQGKPGDWQVLSDEVPATFAPLTAQGPSTARVPVLAQVSPDPTDERFPLLILDDEVYGDFRLAVKLKTVSGVVEQMAGVAFRLQDERNFYVARLSSRGNNFRFYRVHDGRRDPPLGPEVPLPSGVWHELSVQCEGNRIRLRLDGQELIPELTDNSYAAGKIALWTKSDAVSYFRDLHITYTPREPLAKALVRDAHQRYPRLLSLRIVAATPSPATDLRVIASTDPRELRQPGNAYDRLCVASNQAYAGKADRKAIVTLPLHDRNGEAIAAVRVELHRHAGETDQSAVARALPIVRLMEDRVRSLRELTE
jgi:hypothetical protein